MTVNIFLSDLQLGTVQGLLTYDSFLHSLADYTLWKVPSLKVGELIRFVNLCCSEARTKLRNLAQVSLSPIASQPGTE